MQKVVYSVCKVNRDEKLKGIGYVSEGNLLIPAISKNGKPYIRVFEDVTDKCRPSVNSDGEYKGYTTVAYQNDNNDYIEILYSIWFKYVNGDN